MDSASVKLDLLERLVNVKDGTVILKIAALLKKAFPEYMTADEDSISDEEHAAFLREIAMRDRGELKFQTREESMAEVRRLIEPGGG